MHEGNGGWYHMGGMSLWWLCGIAAVAGLIWFGLATARARGGPNTPECNRPSEDALRAKVSG